MLSICKGHKSPQSQPVDPYWLELVRVVLRHNWMNTKWAKATVEVSNLQRKAERQ